MKTSKYFVVATLFATLSLGLLSCEDDDKLVYITMPTSGTEEGYKDGIWYDFDSSTKTAMVTCKGSHYTEYDNEYTGEVVIPSTVTYEGEEYRVTSIGNEAFYGCRYLKSITLPSSLTSIGRWAFNGCSSLTSITLPSSLTYIGYAAFFGCSSLTSITLPSSLTTMIVSVFSGCSSLMSIYVAPNNKNYASIDGVLFSKDKTILIKCPEGKDATSYTIPDGVTEIGDYAFYCSSLTSITIPESVTKIGGIIGNTAFSGCSSLTSMTCKNTTPPSISDGTFEYVDKSILLYVPAESVEAYKNAEGWKEFTNIQAIL